jgi:ribonuclease P protein component
MGRSVRLRQRQTAFATRLLRVVSLGNNDHVYQTHLSALCGQAQAHARISGPHAIARRARRAERAPRQGSQATGDLSEGRLTAAYVFSRAHRLQSEAEFAAVAQAGPNSIRLSQRWFVLTARPIEVPSPDVPSPESGRTPARRVRFGLTVGKRLARRSVDRVLVKRILREAARHSAPDLEALARMPFDVVLRLKAPLPAQDALPRGQLKRALRADADMLLRRFRERLTDRPAADQTT